MSVKSCSAILISLVYHSTWAMDTELPKNKRYLLKIFMANSKKAITRRWLNTEPPTVNQWEAMIKP